MALSGKFGTTKNFEGLHATAAIVACVLLLVFMIAARMPRQDGPKAPQHRLPGGPAKQAQHAEDKRRAEIRQRFEQGVAMLQMGEFQHAVTAFHRVLELNPRLPEAHINMGFAFFELGNHAGAQKFFEGALALAPQLHNARYGLAIALQAQGQLHEARATLETYLAAVEANDVFRVKAQSRLREIERALSAPSERGSKPATPAAGGHP